MKTVENLGVGLGLRGELAAELLASRPSVVDWLEIHPENFIERGGPLVKQFEEALEFYPIRPHGLTLSFGNTSALPFEYLKKLKVFLKKHRMTWYTDHLCFSEVDGRFLHDLLPIPFNESVARHVAQRLAIVQDFLEVKVGIENTSYYDFSSTPEMSECEFISLILEKSKAYLLCDVNNLYVNELNHGTDAAHFIQNIDVSRIIQIHVAGHERRYKNLVIDNHGHSVCEGVLKLLQLLGTRMPLKNVLLERDSNIDSLSNLLSELSIIKEIVNQSQQEVA